MAETLISPGVLARENDQTQITSQPIQAGAAVVGPTVKGQVGIPTLVTSYSEYTSKFGGSFTSASEEYSHLTAISAYSYFQNGGSTLLVTKVASGAFSEATSSTIFNDIESGDIPVSQNLLGSITSGGTGGTANVNTSITPTYAGAGTGLTLSITTANTLGKLILTQEVVSIIASNSSDATNNAGYTNTSLTGGTGTGAVATVVVAGNAVTSIIITSVGTGYVDGDTLTIPTSVIGGTTAVTITLGLTNLLIEPTIIKAATQGTGYAVGETLTVPAGVIGNSTANLVLTLVDANITDSNAFTLETIGQGVIMNSDSTLSAAGSLPSGSADNIRWEIISPNTSSGVFSVIIRRGNDNTKSKSVLESFTNVSLDPKSPNYIARQIGDMKQTKQGTGVDTYLKTSGNYPNASRYVRVKSVTSKTPDYLDNDGNAKSEYTSSIPISQSGSFGSAEGSILTGTGKYYDKISAADTQGLVGTDYTDVLHLLANKDEFRYNVITTPGLIYANAGAGAQKSALNTLISNTEGRGDAIIVVDLENYGSNVIPTTSTAASLDTSYAAAYWPWVMISDPNTGQLVWVPASTLIPGVYASNDNSAEAWFAPAGINRGGLGTVVQAERKLTQANRDQLYTGKVNPIATFPGKGVVVFGQKTLQTKPTALDRINVRRLLIELKSYISQVSDNLVFEQNSGATRNTFLSSVNPYLTSVQQRQGLYAFKVVMDDSNNTADVIDRNQLVGAIYIQPTKTAEFIYLDFNILPTGATFPA
tara:strand:- start:776 stop:3058 length:2283 start_codon:yes stop_codon:yes gene_type:complete